MGFLMADDDEGLSFRNIDWMSGEQRQEKKAHSKH